VLASDGVWEFLSSQAVCTSVMSFTDPVAACRSIIAQAYALWLQFDVRTDDITMILAYIDTAEGQAPRPASEAEIASYEAAQHIQGSAAGLDAESTADAGGAKPVRRGLTEEKRKQMGMASTDEEAEWDTDVGDWKLEVIHKSEAEIKRIKAALKGNFLFQNLPTTQTKQIYDAMKKRTVKANDVVIQQGEKGEEFFVLDEGELAVSILNNSVEVEIMRYRPNPAGANPCFGELALMYSKPRAATVAALTDGVLWAIDRRSFREILKKSSKDKYLMRTLRSVEVLKSLSVSQLQRLGEAMEEAEFKGGESILSQGDYGDSFYIIAQGSARVVKEVDGEYKHVGTITEGQYFGERALLKEEPRAASVVAEEGGKPLKCLFISKQVFEEVLGSLQEIINKEAIHRSKVAFVKQLKKKAAGLNNAKIEDFVLQGEITNAPPTRYVLAQHRAKNYTIRATSKKQVVELGLKQRLRDEMRLLTIMQGDKKHVPIALQTMEDDSYIYSIYPTRTACLLSTLLEDEDEGHFTEPVAMFYTACLVEALEHLHNEAQSTGGVIYRNLCPSGISINESGYPQLLDMRFATIAEPPPRDYCGFAHYLSPEQVSGLGHALPSDFWQLGVLVYEMVTAGNPWLTGDPAKDSEVAVFNRITSHKAGEIRFPDGIELSSGLIKLINGLMEPNVAKRLGSKNEQMAAGYAFQQIREHEWFKENFKDPRSGEPNFAKLHAGTLVSPHKSSAEQYISACIAQNSNERQSSVRDNYFDEVYEGEDDFEGVAPTAPTYGRRASKNIAEVVMEASRKKQRKAELEKKKETRMQRAEKRMKGDEGAGEEGAGEEGASQLSMKEQNARLSVRPREADGAGKSDDDPNFTLGLDSANYKPNVRSEVATIQTNSRASSADALIDGGGDADESASKPEKSDDKNWVKRLSKGAADLANELAGLTTPKQNAPQGAAAPISTTTVPAAKPNLSA
jgi:CRP-like cAMP-binding protein